MVPFAGWEMPVQYEGVRQEHVAVRTKAGLFDVSHMGEIETRGRRATEFLRHLLTNDIDKVTAGGAQYSLLCQEGGGVLDDLFTYRFPGDERYVTVVNASNADTDFAWFAKQAESWDGAEVIDRSADYAMLAFQGPEASSLIAPLLEGIELPERFRFAEGTVAGAQALICRTGYTGEDGVELLLAPDDAESVWDTLIDAGATPAGLGARDTLRLEAGLPLHGRELGPGITPLQAGLAWVVRFDKGDFRGRLPLEAERERGVARRLRGLSVEGRQIPREGYPVSSTAGTVIGAVTSGNFSPTLGHAIALAFLRPDIEPGAVVALDVRGQVLPGEVVKLPFVKR